MSILCTLASAFVLGACGGGSDSGDAGGLADDGRAGFESAQAASDVWTVCARESQRCDFEGTREVRYGTDSKFYTRTLTGGTDCSNAVFGDPAVAQTKTCRISGTSSSGALAVAAAAAANEVRWEQCARESQTCSFTGTRQVRYGTASSYVTRSFTSSVSCSNSVFGDPAVAQTKWCWYADVASVVSPPVVPAAEATDTAGWTRCVSEGGQCSFSGLRNVRYGTESRHVTRQIEGGTACTNAVFGDPAVGQGKSCSYSALLSAAESEGGESPAPINNANAVGARPPIVFNASRSARAGDIVSLQGAHFGRSPRVVLAGTGQSLAVVNSLGDGWLAARIPSGSHGGVGVQVVGDAGTSKTVWLNQARPWHLDATRIVPAGAFRVFGQSLLFKGYTPRVTVNGRSATVNVAASHEHMLVVKAPSDLGTGATATISVDNGNGSGTVTMDRRADVDSGLSGDPFQLGVGWGAAFSTTNGRVIQAASDSRLSSRVVCDGRQNISTALQAAVNLASQLGGATVRLPSGTCRLSGTVALRAGVVVEGAGKAATQLRYESNYPFNVQRLDRVGLRNFALISSGAASEGPLVKENRRVFLQNLRIDIGRSRQLFLTGNRDMVVSGVDFVQRESISEQGPYTFSTTQGLVFTGNTTSFVGGSNTFARVHDAWIANSQFTRDASNQNVSGAIHSLAMDFAYRIAISGNTFDVRNGPIWNKTRNDGETLLTEGGANRRTETLGNVTRGGSNTATLSASLNTDPFGEGALPSNYGIALVAGTGAGQTRRVVSVSGSTVTVEPAWDVAPDSSTRFSTFVWGLEQAVIRGNRLEQNPRGIWLYHTGVRDVDIVDNDIREGGGIYLRSFQDLSRRHFMPIYNVRIAGNSVSNTRSQWSSYINAVFVNADAKAFGIANLGIEIRDNRLVANSPNVSSNYEEYVGIEGFMNMMRVENYSGYESMSVPRQLGTVIQRNQCDNCDVAFRIGTGAGGTVLSQNQRSSSRELMTDWATTTTREKSVATFSE